MLTASGWQTHKASSHFKTDKNRTRRASFGTLCTAAVPLSRDRGEGSKAILAWGRWLGETRKAVLPKATGFRRPLRAMRYVGYYNKEVTTFTVERNTTTLKDPRPVKGYELGQLITPW